MPANLHYFLIRYLSIVRFKLDSFDAYFEALARDSGLLNYEMIASEEKAEFSYLLNDCGYKFSFSRNLIFVMSLACVLLTLVAIFGIIDFVKARNGGSSSYSEYRRTAFMTNFSLRFVYEFFFEICLCLLIHSAVAYGADDLLYVISIILFLCMLIFIALLFAFFCKWGPYTVPNSYSHNSLRKSWWGTRTLCSED